MIATAVRSVNEKQSTNGARPDIEMAIPYYADITVRGVAPLLFHAWNVEAVAEKGRAAKGSKAKKTDNIESYVYRLPDERLGIPGTNLHATLCEAARYQQDPRSPRKSMRDLIKAAIVPLDVIAPFQPDTKKWDYEDARRVTVQRAGVTRIRPAMREGWTVQFRFLVNTPEYLSAEALHSLAAQAGRLVGLCDFRPTYGRFEIAGYQTQTAFD